MTSQLAYIIVYTIIALVSLMGTLYIIYIRPHFQEFNSMKKTLNKYNSTYLHKNGGTTTFGPKGLDNPVLNYDLRSWDRGKNWYVVDNDHLTGGLKVLGPVDTIYPGLLEHLNAWDSLTAYVRKHGPIDPSDTVGVSAMSRIGFSITKNDK